MILAGDFIPKTLRVVLPKEFCGQLLLANLEGPVCADDLPKADKVGPCLHTSSKMFDVQVEGGRVRLAFSLANNHVMDFRNEGLFQTFQCLRSQQIPFSGAGLDEADARKPMVLQENGRKIVVFCCCERQFGLATLNTPGVAAKGLWLLSAIREEKSRGCDYVIVSCHCACEHSPFVSPELRSFYHALIDAGADVIHGHHAHVPQGYEVYREKPIFYGLGNFVVDPEMWSRNSNQLWSLVADMTFGDKLEWSVRPCSVCREGDCLCVRPITSAGKQSYIETANRQFDNDELLNGLWQEASCRLYTPIYEQDLRAVPVATHPIARRERLHKVLSAVEDCTNALLGREVVKQKNMVYARVRYNLANCESHVDVIRTALGVFTGSIPDLRTGETAELADRVMGRKGCADAK